MGLKKVNKKTITKRKTSNIATSKKMSKKVSKKVRKKSSSKKKIITNREKLAKIFWRLRTPSEALSKIIGSAPISKPDAIKLIWTYIKKNNLKDPKKRLQLISDEALLAITNKDSFSLLELVSLIEKHLD